MTIRKISDRIKDEEMKNRALAADDLDDDGNSYVLHSSLFSHNALVITRHFMF